MKLNTVYKNSLCKGNLLKTEYKNDLEVGDEITITDGVMKNSAVVKSIESETEFTAEINGKSNFNGKVIIVSPFKVKKKK